MQGLELLEKYPKAATVVRDYYLEIMLESLKDDSLPENFKDAVREQGINDDMIASIIDNGPRSLFDVLDSNKLYIQITKTTYWNWEVDGIEGNGLYTSREETEKSAIEKALELLNDKQ